MFVDFYLLSEALTKHSVYVETIGLVDENLTYEDLLYKPNGYLYNYELSQLVNWQSQVKALVKPIDLLTGNLNFVLRGEGVTWQIDCKGQYYYNGMTGKYNESQLEEISHMFYNCQLLPERYYRDYEYEYVVPGLLKWRWCLGLMPKL